MIIHLLLQPLDRRFHYLDFIKSFAFGLWSYDLINNLSALLMELLQARSPAQKKGAQDKGGNSIW